jgi:hypothetical protein
LQIQWQLFRGSFTVIPLIMRLKLDKMV